MSERPIALPLADARRIWLRAQRLDSRAPFGAGPDAAHAAIRHLGYVQIDTINVIERSHHHILFTRIPDYSRADLRQAQSVDKSVFEYWTHALAYVAIEDFRFFWTLMKAERASPTHWYADAEAKAVLKLARQIRRDGPISIRDIEEEPEEKLHLWASRKPSKRVLQRGFFEGRFAISERAGMVKTYDLMERHFGWTSMPRAATPGQVAQYRLERALRSQGVISEASAMYQYLRFSPEMQALVEGRVRPKTLVPVTIEGVAHWATPEVLEPATATEPLVHILSPFDPLIIQRKRLSLFFGYDHVFEAYVRKEKRRFGYFTLPVLLGDEIVALLDLKADREASKLLIQAWHWLPAGRPRAHKKLIEAELQRFAKFQFGD